MLTPVTFPAKPGSIFDTHAHYDDDAFGGEYDVLFSELKQYGVCGGIICGCDVASSKRCLSLINSRPGWYAAAGFHPENLPDSMAELDRILPLYEDPKTVAVGEIGLDYHWNLFPKEYQRDCFIKQIETANRLDLPVIVHDRESHADMLEILKKYRPKGVVHCFSGSPETALEIVKLGMYIGIGGVMTFKNARRCAEVVGAVPIDRLLLETDAPYMAPEPYRGKINHSGMIIYIAKKIAEIKNNDFETVLRVCKENAFELFEL